MIRARVYHSATRKFDCKIYDTNDRITAYARGNLLKNNETIVVGDYVKIEQSEENGEYQIIEVENRKNEIYQFRKKP